MERRISPVIKICVAGFFLVLVAAFVIENLESHPCGGVSCRMISQANQRNLTLQCVLWSQSHRGRWPPNIATVFASADKHHYSARVLVNPYSGHTPLQIPPADRHNAQWIEAHLKGHCDYVYAGRGLRGESPQKLAGVIVFYGRPRNDRHRAGCNVAWGNVRARWFRKSQLPAVFAKNNVARRKAGFPPLIFGPNMPPP